MRFPTTSRLVLRLTAFLALLYSLLFHAAHAFMNTGGAVNTGNNTLIDVNKNIEKYATSTFDMIKVVGVVVGLIVVFGGVMRIKKSNDPGSNDSPAQGVFMIVLGGALAALPWILLMAASTVAPGP